MRSLENYHTYEDNDSLLEAIRADFISLAVSDEIAKNICIGAGSTNLFCLYLQRIPNANDIILVPSGYYHEIPVWCEAFGLEARQVHTEPENAYKLTAQCLTDWLLRHRASADRVHGVIVANPSVTGAVYTARELEQLAEVILQHRMTLIYDLVYAGTEFNFPNVSRFAVQGELARNCVVLRSPSKSLGLANLRIGWICGPSVVIEELVRYRELTMGTVPFLSQAMAAAGLSTPTTFLQATNAECAARAALVKKCVGRVNAALADHPKFGFYGGIRLEHDPLAGHSLLLSAPGVVGMVLPDGSELRDSLDLCSFLSTQAGVLVSPGFSMGFDETQFRLSVGPIGHKETYLETAAHERLAASCAVRGDVVPPLADLMPHEGFARGRHLIETAIMDRMLPAVAMLLQKNR